MLLGKRPTPAQEIVPAVNVPTGWKPKRIKR
jgi:hypothetical protein